MKMRGFALLCALVLGSVFAQADAVIDLGSLSRSDSEQPISVRVAGGTDTLAAYGRKAFGMHGRYALAKQGEPAHFVVYFEEAGPNKVRLKIASGQPEKVLFEEQFEGSNLREAFYKAVDKAVVKTAGLPGFFSGKIAFSGLRDGHHELFTTGFFFEDVQQKTFDKSDAVLANFSPDGEQLFFTTYFKSGFPDIYVMDLVSGRRRSFAAYKGTNSSACVSPSGGRVAMVLSPSGTPELYIADAHTGKAHRITRSSGSIKSSPTWSPDEKRIALAADFMGKPQLYTVATRGGELERIPTNISGYCVESAWNPKKANLLAFTAATAGTFQVALYDFDTRKSAFLTGGKIDHLEPCWLNDGRHLIVTERCVEYERLCLLDSVTGKLTPLHGQALGKVGMAAFCKP